MFDPFFCDNINGHELYDGNEFDEPEYNKAGSKRLNSRYIDSVESTYHVYGVKLATTKKATLFKLVTLQKKEDHYKNRFVLGPEKWLPNSEIRFDHISDFDQTDEDFSKEFLVTGIEDLNQISVPGWLIHTDDVLKTVFSVR